MQRTTYKYRYWYGIGWFREPHKSIGIGMGLDGAENHIQVSVLVWGLDGAENHIQLSVLVWDWVVQRTTYKYRYWYGIGWCREPHTSIGIGMGLGGAENHIQVLVYEDWMGQRTKCKYRYWYEDWKVHRTPYKYNVIQGFLVCGKLPTKNQLLPPNCLTLFTLSPLPLGYSPRRVLQLPKR